MLLPNDILQRKDNDIEKTLGSATSQAPTPPPLLHRPAKRYLEQSRSEATIPAKYPRGEKVGGYFGESHARLFLKKKANFRAEVFEKTRSPRPSSKVLRPPPPLLKQDETNKTETRKHSLQDHYSFSKGEYEPKTDCRDFKDKPVYTKSASPLANTKNITMLCDQDSEGTETMNAKQNLSHSPADGKAEPLPREILKGTCKTTCGGFAFDHTAMPKIVAVHSISKHAEDMDEWERNKAFISKVKAQKSQNIDAKEEGEEIPHRIPLETKTIPEKNQQGSVQGTYNFQEPENSNLRNETNAASVEVSFERYVLYHLLSKFQGDVERVRNILKQNLLQEWLSHCQGNVDPKLQTFSGVNFYELRRLYEIWCQLQKNSKRNQSQGSIKQTTFNAQSLEPKQLQIRSDSSFSKILSNSQDAQNSKNFQAAYSRLSQKNCPPKNVSNWKDNVPETLAKISSSPSHFQERILSGANEVNATKIRQKGHSLEQASSHQTSPLSSSLSHYSSFQGNKLTAKTDMGQVQSVMKHVPRDHNLKTDKTLCPLSREQVVSSYEASERMRGQSKIVFREQERVDGTNISSVTLLHISQTNSKTPSFDTVRQETICSSLSSQSPYQVKQANELEAQSKSNARNQETSGNYLWRFKGGKLISDNIPCIGDDVAIPEVDIKKLTSGQQRITEEKESWQALLQAKGVTFTSGKKSHNEVSATTPRLPHDQGCNPEIRSHEIPTLGQQHKRVCGAVTSGKPCFCVLETKAVTTRSSQAENTPIRCLQQLLKIADEKSPSVSREESSAYDKAPNCRSVHTSSAAQDKQKCYIQFGFTRNAESKHSLHTQRSQPYAGLGISSTSPNLDGNQKVHVECKIENHGQKTSTSYIGHTCLTNGQAVNRQIDADHRNDGRAQTNEDLIVSRSAVRNNQSFKSQETYENAQTNQNSQSNINTRENIFHAQPSQDIKSSRLYCSRNESSNLQCNRCLKILTNEQRTNQLTSEHIARDSEENSVSSKIGRIAQANQQIPNGLRNDCNENTRQHSKASAHVLQTLARSHQSNGTLYSLLSVKPSQPSSTNVSLFPNLQEKERSSPSVNVRCKAETEKQPITAIKTSVSTNSNQRSQSGLNIRTNTQPNRQSEQSFCFQRETQQANQTCNAILKTVADTQPNRQATPSFHVSRAGQSFQQPSIRVSRNSQGRHPSTVSPQMSQTSTSTVVRIAPKVDNIQIQKREPTLSKNSSSQNASLPNSKDPVVIKSERVKNQKGSSPASPAPKKPYDYLQQLAKKVIETRERYTMEKIPWKKKILKSLEAVLMKRLRKIEKDTGEKANLVEGENSAAEVNRSNKK